MTEEHRISDDRHVVGVEAGSLTDAFAATLSFEADHGEHSVHQVRTQPDQGISGSRSERINGLENEDVGSVDGDVGGGCNGVRDSVGCLTDWSCSVLEAVQIQS